MKIKYSPFVFVVLIVVAGFLGNSYFRNENIENSKVSIPKPVKSNSKFDIVRLFDYKTTDVKSSGLEQYIKSGTLLNLKIDNLRELVNSKKENIILEIPLDDKSSVNFELTIIPILSDDFRVTMITANGVVPFTYKPGVYYKGIIKDNSNSTVSISIFENSVMGIVSDETGNYNLGVLK